MFQVISLRVVRDRDVPYECGQPLGNPEAVVRLWWALHPDGEPDREQVWLVALDTRNRPTCASLISQGGLRHSILAPRDVFSIALSAQASRIILIHNHPSGDPSPSADDRAISERIRTAGELLDIPLLDHVIVGDGAYFSLASEAPVAA